MLMDPMNFDSFLQKIKKDFVVRESENNTYILSKDGTSIEILKDGDYDYEDFTGFFNGFRAQNKGDSHHDLYPTGNGIGNSSSILGSTIGSNHRLFLPRNLRKNDDPRFSRFAKFDPVLPTKDRSRGFEPDPDHLRKFGPDDNHLL